MILRLARFVIHSYRRYRIQTMHGQTKWCKVPAGFWMFIDPQEWQGRTILMGYFESDLAYLIAQILHSGDIALDIGANQGYIALHMARAVGTGGRVIAIEPVTLAFKKLVQNARRNKMYQINCIQCAIGDREGEIEIWVASESGWSSVFKVTPQHSFQETVRLTTGDAIVAETLGEDALSHITFIKIDVEGYEPLVLDGIRRILHQSRPIVWIEVNPPVLAKGGYRPGDIEQRLNAFGYRFFKPHFQRNMIGIPSLYLEPYADFDVRLGSKMENLLAAVPNSQGWQRIRSSKIRVIGEGLNHV